MSRATQKPRKNRCCLFPGCDAVHCCHGYCAAHAKQLMRGQELRPLGMQVCMSCKGLYKSNSAIGRYCASCKWLTTKCAQCGSTIRYLRSRKGKPPHYCSNSCKLAPRLSVINCPMCGIAFKPSRSSTKYCSNKCRGVAYVRNAAAQRPSVVKNCECCGNTFVIDENTVNYTHRVKNKRFCSVACGVASTNKARTYLVDGDEKVMTFSSGVQYRMIRVAGKWVRKDRLVLESFLGRRLNHREKSNIVHVDGDYLNCDLNNLVIPSTGKWVTRRCLFCGDVKVISKGDLSKFRGRCKACLHERKMSLEVVACIRQLLFDVPSADIRIWFDVCLATVRNIFNGKTWKGVAAMAAKDTWKVLLKQHDLLKKKATASVYDRVKLLVLVWENPGYLEDCRKNNKSPGEDMNSRVNDTCANWTELFQMLKMFPNKKDWTNGDLSKMRMDMLNKLREQQNGKKEKKPRKKIENRQSATLKELRELEEERDRLKDQLENANKIIEGLQNQVASLTDQLGGYRSTVNSLNETIRLLQEKSPAPRQKKTVKA